MAKDLLVDPATLREQVREKYREVATDPHATYHFHTGRQLAARLGYDSAIVDRLPDVAVESFAGVNNPFSMGDLQAGQVVVDVGSGAGFDALLAARMVGPSGHVIGVDMTAEMREKAAANARLAGVANVEWRDGLAEELPLDDASADVVISNGAINLCPDKPAVYREIHRVLRSGGRIQISDVVVQKPVPAEARADIDLWTG